MNKKIALLLGVLIIFTIIFYYLSFKAGASYTESVCNADHKYDCVTPTPTKNPCNFWQEDKYEEDCITPIISPSPTVTPEASPSATPIPVNTNTQVAGASGGQSNNPPPVAQCTNNAFVGPVIVSFTDKGNGTVNFAWTEITGGINKYSMIYGLNPNALVYGQDNIPGNVWNWDIHDLPVGSHVWAQVVAWQNGCAVYSNEYDPIVR